MDWQLSIYYIGLLSNVAKGNCHGDSWLLIQTIKCIFMWHFYDTQLFNRYTLSVSQKPQKHLSTYNNLKDLERLAKFSQFVILSNLFKWLIGFSYKYLNVLLCGNSMILSFWISISFVLGSIRLKRDKLNQVTPLVASI